MKRLRLCLIFGLVVAMLFRAAPVRAAPPDYPQVQGQITHVVQPGQNLFRISLRYGTSVRNRANLPQKALGQFNVSGRYTGLLNGWVDISGEEILVTEATRFFFTDKGLVRGAPMLVGQPVYVSGITRRDGISVATFVIVQSR